MVCSPVLIAMVSWGEVGHRHTWDALGHLVPSQTCNVVVQLAVVEPGTGSALGVIFPNNVNVRVQGLINIREATQSVSLIDAVFVGVKRIPTFKVSPTTLVFQHSPVRVSCLQNVVELCAGIGVATTGLDFVGFSTKLAVELRAPFAEVFASLHPDAKVITGDINNQQCLKEIMQYAPGSCMLVAGFNCQPYSRAGAMKGIGDQRAESLHGVLNVAFYLRAPLIVLECVVEASSNRHVQEELQTFCTQCGYHMSDVTLRLEDAWPCRRERWWVVMSASAIGKVLLKPIPVQPFPSMVKQVLPRPLRMTESDVEQLRISGVELERFQKFMPDLQSMMVSLQGKCPTLLHSIGSQVTGCLCKCRDQGFSNVTLAKGLFGIVMPINGPEFCVEAVDPQIRHPHPNELALLSAVIPRPDWHGPHRLILAGLGQQANPIHSLWIASQVLAHLQLVVEGHVDISPRSVLEDYISDVLKWCKSAPFVPLHSCLSSSSQVSVVRRDRHSDDEDESMPPVCETATSQVVEPVSLALPTCHQGDVTTCTVVFMQTGASLEVSVPRGALIGNLIAAEAELHGSGSLVEVLDPITQEVLEASESLPGRCVWVRTFSLTVQAAGTSAPSGGGESVVVDVPEISPTVPFKVSSHGSPNVKSEEVAVPSDPIAAVDPCPEDQEMLAQAEGLDEGSVKHEPLVGLSQQQFVELPHPTISCMQQVDALLGQTMDAQVRLHLLDAQGTDWADDELRWHIWQCMDRSSKEGVVMMDPLIATAASQAPSCNMLEAWFRSISCLKQVIVSAVRIDSHWSPLIWTWTSECLTAHSWDIPALIPNIRRLNDALSKVAGARTFHARVLHRMDGTMSGCGVCAVRYIDHFLTGKMLPTTRDDIEYLHQVGKGKFRQHVTHARHLNRPWCWGNGLDSQAHSRLLDLL